MVQFVNRALVELQTRKAEAVEGQGLVEYALIIVLISIVAVGAMVTVGDEITGIFDDITGAFDGVGSGDGGSGS